MGSWANSVHVRHDDSRAVAEAVKALILATGWKIGVAQPVAATQPVSPANGPHFFSEREDIDWDDDDAAFEANLEDYDEDDAGPLIPVDDEPRERSIVIYKPVNGWVTILDSAGLESDLAQELSKRLRTDAMMVYVNDSDSWGFELRRNGQSIDRFDSSGDLDEEGLSPEWQRAMENEDEEELERLLYKNAPQGPIVFHDGRMAPPPEMGRLKARMAEGRATLGDRLRYFWLWIKFQCRRFWGWLFPSSLQFGFDVPQGKPLDAETLQEHLRTLGDVFPNGDARALKVVLPQSRFPAEGLLKDFLEAVKLPGIYAHLSYDYRDDFGADELESEGVIEAAELRFVPPPRKD